MILFITHPKYFDRRKIRGKKPDLVFVFNSKEMFDKFDEKCVNIGWDGKIKHENFFKKDFITLPRNLVINRKLLYYTYYKKILHNQKKKHYYMIQGYKDALYNLTHKVARDMAKKDINDAIEYVDKQILNTVIEILTIKYSQEELNSVHIAKLYNIYNSFFRAYIYSMNYKRGMEFFGDLFKYTLFINTILDYKYRQKDLYNDFFHYNYLRVVSRLFIETICKNDIKSYIDSAIIRYKENKWLS